MPVNAPMSTGELSAAIDGRTRSLVDLAASLIRRPSENPPGGEREAVAVVRSALDDVRGVDVRIVAPAPGRDSLIATAGPRGVRTLFLGAHIDTVPAGDGWTRSPFGGEVTNATVYGRGASDNKGAVAAMLVAFRELVAQGITEGCRVIFVANADEERGGSLGIDHVLDVLGEPIDAALVGEPSGVSRPFETLYVAARGALRFTVRAKSSSGHTSLLYRANLTSATDKLEDALVALREQLPQLRRLHPLHGHSDLVTVRLDGGSGWGVVPGEAHADLELRVVPGVSKAQAEEDIRNALKGTGAEVTFAPGSMRWVSPSEVSADVPITRAAKSAWRSVLGMPPSLGCFPGGTDGRRLSAHGIPTIPAIGPGTLLRAHAPDEYVTAEELRIAAQLYALTAARYLLDRDQVNT